MRYTYTYDQLNRMRTLLDPHGGTTTFGYDADGWELQTEHTNGVVVSNVYDDAGDLLTRTHIGPGSVTISRYEYTYNAAGYRTTVVEANGTSVTWTLDDAYQLTGEARDDATPAWSTLTTDEWSDLTTEELAALPVNDLSYNLDLTYDAMGNPLVELRDDEVVTSTFDDANRVRTVETVDGTTTYSYDAVGNRTQKTEPSGLTTTYTWNDDNRLVQVVLPSGGGSYAFAYNTDGLRVSRQTPSGESRHLWNGQVLAADTDPFGTTTADYVQRPHGFGRLIARHHQDGLGSSGGVSGSSGTTAPPADATFLHDGTENAAQVTDQDGQVAATRAFDAFGRPLGFNESVEAQHAFAAQQGYVYEPAIDLYYLRQRWYDPRTRQFISPDRHIATGDGFNAQRFCRNLPTEFFDPSGLDPAPNTVSDTTTYVTSRLGVFGGSELRSNWVLNPNAEIRHPSGLLPMGTFVVRKDTIYFSSVDDGQLYPVGYVRQKPSVTALPRSFCGTCHVGGSVLDARTTLIALQNGELDDRHVDQLYSVLFAPVPPRLTGAMRIAGATPVAIAGVAGAPETFGTSLAFTAFSGDQIGTGFYELIFNSPGQSTLNRSVERLAITSGASSANATKLADATELATWSVFTVASTAPRSTQQMRPTISRPTVPDFTNATFTPLDIQRPYPRAPFRADFYQTLRASLPAFDQKTVGILFTDEGYAYHYSSGNGAPIFSNYPAASHVEGQAAVTIGVNGSTGGILFHNHPGGTCPMCVSNTPSLLPFKATLDIVPPFGASNPSPAWRPYPITRIGNENPPRENPNFGR